MGNPLISIGKVYVNYRKKKNSKAAMREILYCDFIQSNRRTVFFLDNFQCKFMLVLKTRFLACFC